MTDPRSYGNLRTVHAGIIAARCADAIEQFASPRAVTIDPAGRVWIESPATAAESDLVGCYACEAGRLELALRIREDLLWEKGQRDLTGMRRRVVVSEAARRAQSGKQAA